MYINPVLRTAKISMINDLRIGLMNIKTMI